MSRFYIVWNPANLKPPAARHPTADLARSEAERLARLNPGQEFYTLHAETVSFVPTSKPPITRHLPKRQAHLEIGGDGF